ncbi:PREDICTED: uncharacterized protein LOC109243892 [Nicotiana attenuata]|uniref:uncharacterized protein LOC109243892 n=1 Tax=Nicotiana attenuata TaxID=49451 RepID=UPI00090547EA|nr:PREDICTED: uncharacterized protein LOC109243892 [Nicotiana attenuata]
MKTRVLNPTDTNEKLSQLDSPGMLLVNTTFDGKGYGGWRRGILIDLSAKNKLRVFILQTAKDIWDELEERFGQSNGPELYHLQKEITESTQENLDIAGYYTKMKRLWDELDSLDVCQHCTYPYSCGGKIKNFKSQQDSRLIQFLMGLNDAYVTTRSNLFMLSPLPTVNHAYSLLIKDEKQREVQISHHPAESVFVAAQRSYGGPKKTSAKKFNTKITKGTQFCNYCKKHNHTIESCYRLIGFPSNFKFTKSKRFNGAKSNAVLYMETSDSQTSTAGDQPMTQDQFHSLY